MNKAVLVLSVLVLSVVASAAAQPGRFRVMTYNVENLYDTCHDAGFDDTAFLPDGEQRWDGMRYATKLSRLWHVIAAAGGESPLALVGLCEVENDSVVRDLCERTRLRRLGYRYVVTHSRDVRGIDVALLYQPELFSPFVTECFVVPTDERYGRPTRDLLHVGGVLPSGDTLDVIVCHMPSRRGGTAAAHRLRSQAALRLRGVADSLHSVRGICRLLILGDFNDEYTDSSIARALGAVPLPATDAGIRTDRLYVLSAGLRAHSGITGSYKYRGKWNMLDQIMVCGHLLDHTARMFASRGDCRIFAPQFLLSPDEVHGGVKPRRTFLGPFYLGGYSDHLPLIMDFTVR